MSPRDHHLHSDNSYDNNDNNYYYQNNNDSSHLAELEIESSEAPKLVEESSHKLSTPKKKRKSIAVIDNFQQFDANTTTTTTTTATTTSTVTNNNISTDFRTQGRKVGSKKLEKTKNKELQTSPAEYPNLLVSSTLIFDDSFPFFLIDDNLELAEEPLVAPQHTKIIKEKSKRKHSFPNLSTISSRINWDQIRNPSVINYDLFFD